MHPAAELNRLAARKALVQVRIAARREECATYAAALGPSFARADRAWELWRRIAPVAKLAGVPLMLLVARRLRRRGRWSTWLRYAPVVLRAARGIAKRRPKRGAAARAATRSGG